MKKKDGFHMNIGGASILLVLVIFSLTVFAVLSLRASYHEMKLAQKNKEAVEAYYAADSKAEEYLQQIDDAVKKQMAEHGTIDTSLLCKSVSQSGELKLEENSNNLTFNVRIGYNMNLEVTIQSPNDQDTGINVTSWRIVSTAQGNYDSNVEEIWDGILDD